MALTLKGPNEETFELTASGSRSSWGQLAKGKRRKIDTNEALFRGWLITGTLEATTRDGNAVVSLPASLYTSTVWSSYVHLQPGHLVCAVFVLAVVGGGGRNVMAHL